MGLTERRTSNCLTGWLPYDSHGASCRVGGRIHLLRERYLFGHLVHADWAHPDPCEERTDRN
jgi:hypothetical protein